MDKNKKNGSKLALVIGIIGSVSGIFLIFEEQWFLGISGTIASLGIAIKGYMDLNTDK